MHVNLRVSRSFQRTEQQRNQALRNAERLTAAFRDYKEDVAEKLKKVVHSFSKLLKGPVSDVLNRLAPLVFVRDLI